MPGKRVQFDDETWATIDMLMRSSRRDFQDIANEAFRDFLAKHHQPADLATQLRESLSESGDAPGPRKEKPRRNGKGRGKSR